MPFLPKYDFDIFISYAHADDREWVDHFYNQLLSELHRQLPGREKPTVFLDGHDLRAGDPIHPKIAAGVQQSALILALVSGKYRASPVCVRDELGSFQKVHGANSDRIFQVIRAPFTARPLVPEVMWVKEDERTRLVEGLAARLIQLRRELTHLYIAWPNHAGDADRRRIEREFKAQKFVIRPDDAICDYSSDEDIRAELADSHLSLHIFTPEPDPLADRQYAIACELERPALIVTSNPDEPRRHHFDPSPVIYLRDPNARRLLIDRVKTHLGPRPTPPPAAMRRLLLLYKPDQDWRHADDLTQMLRNQGADIFPPPDPYPDPYLNLDAYVDDLRQSAGVVVCWGDAPNEWLDGVERKLSVLRIREEQIGALTRAKYFAEPPIKHRTPGRDEFIIRDETDLSAFLKAAGLGQKAAGAPH